MAAREERPACSSRTNESAKSFSVRGLSQLADQTDFFVVKTVVHKL